MIRETWFLNPKRKLLDETVDWLLKRVRPTPEGAISLDHLLVVMPTAQSGRNLRLALAKRFPGRGLIAPRILQPMGLVIPADATLQTADEAEIAALFLKFLETRPRRRMREGRVEMVEEWTHLFRPEAFEDKDAGFALLDQLTDIWHVLSGGGLLMGEVAGDPDARAVLEAAQGDEVERWEELAELEAAFFAFLRERGLRHPAEAFHLAKRAAKAVPDEIETVVLPALADPVAVLCDVLCQQRETLKVAVLLHAHEEDAGKFDVWGRPRIEAWTGDARPVIEGLTERDILCATDSSDLAGRLAADFPKAESGLALPSLALCDTSIFPELSAAFLNAGYVVHNPECHRLAISSLGRLFRDLLTVWKCSDGVLPWGTFVSLFRSDDVMNALKASGYLPDREVALEGLDLVQNRCLPTRFPLERDPAEADFRRYEQPKVEAFRVAGNALMTLFAAAREKGSLAAFIRNVLCRVFAGKTLTEAEGEKEFREAAACVWQILDALSGEVVEKLALADNDLLALANRLLAAATYSLEPESPDVVKTEGWLELVWSDGEKLALAGFHEGSVPDSVIGHAFLPNRLREALRLTSNTARLARDTWLLKELVDSHAPHAVHAYIARTNTAGDICRPSRLLFLCSDAAFSKRVGTLFGEIGNPSVTPPRRMAPTWMLRLPDEVTLPYGHLTASAIDCYLKSPLTYLLQYGIGMRHVEEKRELGADDFGTLTHRVLELYANEQLARGQDQLTDVDAIQKRLNTISDGVFSQYGDRPSTNVRLQLDAVRCRLMSFAKIQARWVSEGWRVAARPEYPFEVKPFADMDVAIKGSVDRIDSREVNGERQIRLIDYKTWDKVSKATSHVKTEAKAQIAFADRLGLPTAPAGKDTRIRLLTVQLPLYGTCLQVHDPAVFAGCTFDYCYLVLGEDEENVKVVGSRYEPKARGAFDLASLAPLALETAKVAIRRIQANLFWPPRPSERDPLYDFEDLFLIAPELDQESGGAKSGWLKRQEEKLEAIHHD